MNILIVDHQPLIRRGIADVLSAYKEEPYEILESGTLADSLKIIQMQSIDIAFVDLHLGSSDGLELIDRAKKIAHNDTKYIILASTISIFEFRRAKELELDGFILMDALAEDVLYAFHVIRRGGKYYPSRIIEKVFYGADGEGLELLTERELDVFLELRKGLTNNQIGRNLFISEGTTKKHISSILNKLKLSNRVEVVLYANKICELSIDEKTGG